MFAWCAILWPARVLLKVASVSAFELQRFDPLSPAFYRDVATCAGELMLGTRTFRNTTTRDTFRASWRDAVGGVCIHVPLVLRRGIKRLELQSHW